MRGFVLSSAVALGSAVALPGPQMPPTPCVQRLHILSVVSGAG